MTPTAQLDPRTSRAAPPRTLRRGPDRPATVPIRRTSRIASALSLVLVLAASLATGWAVLEGSTAAGDGSAERLATAAAVLTGSVLAGGTGLLVAVVALARERPRGTAVLALLTSLVLPWLGLAAGVLLAAPDLGDDLSELAGAGEQWLGALGEPGTPVGWLLSLLS